MSAAADQPDPNQASEITGSGVPAAPAALTWQRLLERLAEQSARQREFKARRIVENHPVGTVSRVSEVTGRATDSPKITTGPPRFAQVVRDAVAGAQRLVAKVDWSAIGTFFKPLLEGFVALLPSNVIQLTVDEKAEVTRLAGDEQLCLAWVPGIDLTRQLLAAPDASSREHALVEHSDEILTACAEALTGREDPRRAAALSELASQAGLSVPTSEVPGTVVLIQEVIAAARSGYYASAQALATCVLDSVATQYLTSNEPGTKVHSKVKRTIERSTETQILAMIVVDALTAFESSYRGRATWQQPPVAPRTGSDLLPGGPPEEQSAAAATEGPTAYSRHATVHAARPEVFTPATALKSILLATSIALVADNSLALSMLGVGIFERELLLPETDGSTT